MKISVITVCFNSAHTIADTMRSVVGQTHADIEHIVVDGASSDDTLAVVRSFESPMLRIVSEPDQGIYDAMNKGISLATGDLVGFLNADDMFSSSQTIAAIAAAAALEPRVDAVYGDLEYVSRDRPSRVLRYWRSGPFSSARLRYGWMPPHPTFYLRRATLQRLGRFDLRLQVAADYDFMLRCLIEPGIRVSYIPEVLVRMRTGGVSNGSWRALLRKSREDLAVLRKNRIGGWHTLLIKNARKLPQFLVKASERPALRTNAK